MSFLRSLGFLVVGASLVGCTASSGGGFLSSDAGDTGKPCGVFGCKDGSADVSNPPADSDVNKDSSNPPPQDAVVPKDTGPNQTGCGFLPTSFACKNDFSKTGDGIPFASSCQKADADQFVKDCFGTSATAETCGPWFDGEKANTPCGQCVMAWTPDSSVGNIQCLYNILGEGNATQNTACGNALKCAVKCNNAVCNDTICNDTKKDSNGDTELDRCYNDSVETACGSVTTADGKNPNEVLTGCMTDNIKNKAGKYCLASNLTSQAALAYFFRFVCSLNGDYTQAATAVNTPAFQ